MSFGGYLQANTAVDVLIGPFVDDTDGKTAETGLTLSQADIKLSKNGQALAQKNDDTAAAHDANGYYNCELDTTDTNTEGTLTLIVHESGALPVRHDFMVVNQAAYASLVTAKDSGFIDVNVSAMSNGAVTAAAIATGAIDADALATDAIDEIFDYVVEGSGATDTTFKEGLRLMLSALVGQVSGAGTTEVTFKACDTAATTRVVATVDASGNRSAVTLTKT